MSSDASSDGAGSRPTGALGDWANDVRLTTFAEADGVEKPDATTDEEPDATIDADPIRSAAVRRLERIGDHAVS